ncbi:MAG: clp protease ATP binding subunit [Candidatus Woesebacteria bacterium GW2011_GWA1_39_21b]|uniref:Clp protease ATP binding subunit n=1 Tax=Candidatus Woesebacteria bacterium GW2011_GWA1_39_21b TaxID=1618551 RepID=A0A0G0N5R5_9BACT|nr:MAG: clp protease ATP binding subunit [Candidatus Woesebacteria bacterium GW2011_GWA1_39_21b]
MVVTDASAGFNFQKKFEAFTFNLVSRGVGAMVRFILFWTGLILIIFGFVGGAIGIVFWVIMPFFGLSVYSKYKRQVKNYVSELLFKIKSEKLEPLTVIFDSTAGLFVLSRININSAELLQNANMKKITFAKESFESFEEVITYLIKNNVWKDEFFNKKEITAEDLILAASWWDRKQSEETSFDEPYFGRPGIALELTFGYTPVLNQYSVDLSLPQSFSHRLIGRGQIVSRMERVLTAGSSVLLMGQPGVGKKTVVLEFARRAASGELGREMAYKRVLEFDYNALLSNATDVNKKKTELAEILAEASSAGNIILMFRDIQRLINPEVEGYDFTDVIEGHLEKRALKIIAVSTNTEYERFIAGNLRIRKYLEKVEVTPPTKDEAMQILIDAAKRWELLTGLLITVPSLRHILDESDRYITEVPFPEKALELLDAVISLKEQQGGGILVIDDVNIVLAEKTGISFARLTGEEKKRLEKIEDIIHERLIDQDIAISLIGKTLRAKTVGVVKEDRPLGSFLFLGPTGVGKTETAKVLAKVYYGASENILRFDMAEYSGREGLERLIGSVSKNLPGALTTAIKNKPASLLLLDEIEKATKEIYNLFLSLLDEGIITDAFGKKIVCRHLFVIGTSNAGAEFVRQLVNRGISGEELQKSVVNHVLEKEIFSPEFLNRFDGVVVYEPLKPDDLVKIAHLMLLELAENLKKKNITLTLTDDTAQKLAKDGYDPAFGARPMKRILNIVLGDLIGRAILKGEINEGDKIKLLPGEGKEEFRLEKVPVA